MHATAQLIPVFILGIPGAIGAYFLAPRLGENKYVWALLSLVPFVNFFFSFYVLFKIIFCVLDKLEAIQKAIAPQQSV